MKERTKSVLNILGSLFLICFAVMFIFYILPQSQTKIITGCWVGELEHNITYQNLSELGCSNLTKHILVSKSYIKYVDDVTCGEKHFKDDTPYYTIQLKDEYKERCW